MLEAEYYAHPQNAFWPIMRELFSIDGAYEPRCQQLVNSRIAVWDVLAQSVRPGSMDADICGETAEANDFKTFFSIHRDIRLVCFNGQKAAQLFRKLVDTQRLEVQIQFEVLPSTSPAYAAMPFAKKLSIWRKKVIVGRLTPGNGILEDRE